MSSAVISTSAATSRPFLFDADPEPKVRPTAAKKPVEGAQEPEESPLTLAVESTIKNQQSTSASSIGNRKSAIATSLLPASRLAIRPAPEMGSSGIPELDALTGGLPRGCLTELCGPVSSGRTSVLLAALAAASRRGEYCALIDASDALDPYSAAAAAIDLDRLLWVRCQESSPRSHRDTEETKDEKAKGEKISGCPTLVPRLLRDRVGISVADKRIVRPQKNETEKYHSERRLEQVLRATDLLLESGGFGLIVLDLADIPPQTVRRIPLTTWFRFRRAVEHKPTILLAIEQHPIAGSCSSLLLQLGLPQLGVLSTQYSVLSSHGNSGDQNMRPTHTHLFTGLDINVELTHSRLERKPTRSIAFESKAAWAG